MKSGFKAIRLLKYGKIGMGTLKSKEPTGTRINNQTVYKLTFEFTAEDANKYEAIVKTHRPAVLEDNAQERLLYDELNPPYSVMLDSLPGAPDIDETNSIRVRSYLTGLLVLIIPSVTFIGHGIYFFMKNST